MLERTSRIPRPRCRATAAHRKAVTESPPHAKKELCKLMDPWPKTCQPKPSKWDKFKKKKQNIWKTHLPNVPDLTWHSIGPVGESCRLSDSGHQRLLLPINAAEEAREHDENRLQGGNPGGDEVIEMLLSWLKFFVSVSIDEYFTHSWLEEFSPRLIIVMLKVRCFLRLNMLNF